MTRRRLNPDELLDRRQAARDRADNRAADRLDRKHDAADRMVGEIVRDGRIVCYVYPAGGSYREGARTALVEFLIRNRYV